VKTEETNRPRFFGRNQARVVSNKISFFCFPLGMIFHSYLRHRLASGEVVVTLAVTLCVCPPSHLYHVSTARHISLGGEGNALYLVLSSWN